MRAILLNDTRSDHHVGCELVVRNTLDQCKQHGIEITSTIRTADADHAPDLISPLLDQNDLVLLNGEGTLHDDRPRALKLLEAASLAKAHGLKIVLYNALWSSNPAGQKHLSNFDLIFCRDSRSSEEILKSNPNLPVEFVPDMIFATPLGGTLPPRTPHPLVTDSVKKKKSLALAKFALKHKLPFAPMGRGFFRHLKSSLFLKYRLTQHCAYSHNKLDTPESYIHKILTSSGIITGRFHTACLAILLQTPVFCISSNTRKIETLYTDIGLSPNLIPQSLSSLDDLQDQWQEQTRLRDQLNEHITRTRKQITLMFAQISNI